MSRSLDKRFEYRRAHLYRQRIREETEEPPERDGRQLNSQVLEMSRHVGMQALNQVAKNTLVRLRDE